MPKVMIKFYDFVSSQKVLLILGIIIITSFLIRVIFPYHVVFGDGYINYLEGDCFSRMYYAKQIHNMPFIDGFLYSVPRGLLFPWTIAMVGYVFPIELVGAWLPPIIAIGVIVLVYLIGKEVFNTLVGLTGALFVAIIPSEFYHRSLLGYPDHHVAEVLLMTLVVYLVIKVIRSGSIINRYSVLLAFGLFLYLATWTAGVLLTALILVMAVIFWFKKISRGITWALSLSVLTGNILYCVLGGFTRYFWWWPGLSDSHEGIDVTQAHAGSLINETVSTIFTPLSERTISELMPLLAPAGSFHVGVLLTNFHLFTITFLVGFTFLWYWRKDRVNLFIIIWTIILVILTLNQRRFMYYLTLPVGLISAWGIYELGQLAKKDSYVVMVLSVLLLVMVSMPIIPLISMTKAYSMPPEWHETLTWLKDEPSEGMVTAWSDYGHWIQYTAEKPPNLFNGPGGKNVAKLLLTDDDNEAQRLIETLSTQYLIVDRATMVDKVVVVSAVADIPVTKNSLGIRLLNGGSVPYLDKIYESAGLKVYEVK